MDQAGDNRAIEVLGDYLYELETNDRKHCRSRGKDRTLANRLKPVTPPLPASTFDKAQEYLADIWEQRRLAAWKQEGRMTHDGYLRIAQIPVNSYTLDDITRLWQHLKFFDRLAALIILDGVVEEGFMDAHENIRAVVQSISREEIEKVLGTPEARERIADIVHEQVSGIFGTLLDKLKYPSITTRSGGKRQRCGKCGIPGHRAKTCTLSADEAADSKKRSDEALKESKRREKIPS